MRFKIKFAVVKIFLLMDCVLWDKKVEANGLFSSSTLNFGTRNKKETPHLIISSFELSVLLSYLVTLL